MVSCCDSQTTMQVLWTYYYCMLAGAVAADVLQGVNADHGRVGDSLQRVLQQESPTVACLLVGINDVDVVKNLTKIAMFEVMCGAASWHCVAAL